MKKIKAKIDSVGRKEILRLEVEPGTLAKIDGIARYFNRTRSGQVRQWIAEGVLKSIGDIPENITREVTWKS